MCNDYRLRTNVATLFEEFSEIRIKIRFSEGRPNIEAREDIKITDLGPIVRAVEEEPDNGDDDYPVLDRFLISCWGLVAIK